MSFEQKDWKDRIAEYINRRRITHEDGTSELITVERDEGTISQEGDAFNAENMNEFEGRIAKALTPLDTMEEINANTQDNQLAGANAVKELKGLLGNIVYKEIINANGTGVSTEHIQLIKDNWNNLSNDRVYILRLISGTTQIAIVQKHSSLYGSVLMLGYFVNQPRVYNLSNGTWTDEYILARTVDLANYLPLVGKNAESGDANTCTVSGTITIGTPSNWSNLPEVIHGILETFNAGYYILQRYSTGGNQRKIYYRFSGNNGASWHDWEKNATETDLSNYLPLAGGTLAGTLISRSIYPNPDDNKYFGDTARPWFAVYLSNLIFAKGGVSYGHSTIVEGTKDTKGLGILAVGNATPTGTAGNAMGQLRLYNEVSGYTSLSPSASADVGIKLPSANGTLMRKEDFVVTGTTDDAKLTINLD